MAEGIYTPKEFAEKIGCSTRTLQRWEERKLLIPARKISGRPYYTDAHYRKALQLPGEEEVEERAGGREA
jgi:DNA-binding transcriptional MerR regulator